MPREIKVFSISVVDLLCCALGGMLLVCFLLIVSIGRPTQAGGAAEFLTASAAVWLDVTGAAADPAECEVQLELYWSAGTGADVPRVGAKPLAVANLGRAGVDDQPLPGGGRVTTHTAAAAAARATVDGRAVAYAGYRMDLAAFEVPRGWYAVRLAVVKRPPDGRLGPATAAWLRLESSGRPAGVRLRTHAALDLPDWPEARAVGDEFPTVTAVADRPGQDDAARDRTRRRLRLPDLYEPTWPAGYPGGPAGGGRFQFCPGAEDGGDWVPFFAIRVESERAAGPAGLRLHQRAAGPAGTAYSDYLPGFQIGGGRGQ